LKWGLSAWDLTLEREGPLLGRKVQDERRPTAIKGRSILGDVNIMLYMDEGECEGGLVVYKKQLHQGMLPPLAKPDWKDRMALAFSLLKKWESLFFPASTN
jgi:hypothetical protein